MDIKNILIIFGVSVLLSSCNKTTPNILGKWVTKNKSCVTICSFIIENKETYSSNTWVSFLDASGLSGALINTGRDGDKYFYSIKNDYYLTKIALKDGKIFMLDNSNLVFEREK